MNIVRFWWSICRGWGDLAVIDIGLNGKDKQMLRKASTCERNPLLADRMGDVPKREGGVIRLNIQNINLQSVVPQVYSFVESRALPSDFQSVRDWEWQGQTRSCVLSDEIGIKKEGEMQEISQWPRAFRVFYGGSI